jgi:hypothetical protein
MTVEIAMPTPHPKNAHGPFYVECGCCIACDAPFHEAPDLMATDDGNGDYHCHFRKQPETPAEVERAINACVVSCVEAVRYAGNDPAILQRFRELNCEGSCDVLSERSSAWNWYVEIQKAAKRILARMVGG